MRTIAANSNLNSFKINTVGDLVSRRRCLTFRPDEFVDVILPVLQNSKEGVAGVLDDEGNLIGLLTERQILRQVFMKAVDPSINPLNLRKYIQDMTVEQAMIPWPETLDENIDIEDAVGMMLRRDYRFMPVVSRDDRHHLLGIASEHEMALHLQHRLQKVKQSEEETKSLLSCMLREPYGVGVQLSSL
jgi:CBS domain-containing protein